VQLQGSKEDIERVYDFFKYNTKKASRILRAFGDSIEFEVTL
jgi:hypothetical protein